MLTIISLLGLVASTYLRRVILAVLVSLELLLLASVLANIQNFLILDESIGQVLIALVITLAGAETSCGLALIVSYYRHLGSISLEPQNI
jgi:NADH:ubiquinone oxidoreductase subunit K